MMHEQLDKKPQLFVHFNDCLLVKLLLLTLKAFVRRVNTKQRAISEYQWQKQTLIDIETNVRSNLE